MSEIVNNLIVAGEDKVKIADDVICVIAGIAASEVESLASMRGGLVDGIGGMFGMKNHSKGVRVEVKENDVVIDMSIIVQYGCKIHEVAKEIQTKVRQAIENMTGLNVSAVNISVLGISVGKDSKKVEMVDDEPPAQV